MCRSVGTWEEVTLSCPALHSGVRVCFPPRPETPEFLAQFCVKGAQSSWPTSLHNTFRPLPPPNSQRNCRLKPGLHTRPPQQPHTPRPKQIVLPNLPHSETPDPPVQSLPFTEGKRGQRGKVICPRPFGQKLGPEAGSSPHPQLHTLPSISTAPSEVTSDPPQRRPF